MKTYEEIRSTITSGNVVFFKEQAGWIKHPIQSIISLATKYKQYNYVHCGIVFWIQPSPECEPRLMVVEAQGGADRRILNLSYYKDRPMVILTNTNATQWSEAQLTALGHLGLVPYGWSDAIYAGIRSFAFNHLHFTLPARNFPGQICSEFAARELGYNYVDVTPNMLYQMMQKNGATVQASTVQ
jgi:hypothetical protein